MKNTRQNSAGIKKKVINVLVHLFLTILSRDLGIPDFLGSPVILQRTERTVYHIVLA